MKYPTIPATSKLLLAFILCLCLTDLRSATAESDISCSLARGEVVCVSSASASAEPTKSRPSCNVKNVQIVLRDKKISVGAADGIFGKATSKGVSKFQQQAGLQQTGLLDAQTCKALGVRKACEDVLDEWMTYDMDKIAAFWGRSKEDAIRIGIKPPAVVPPKGCQLRLDAKGSKVTPYCNGKALSPNSCLNPFGVDPLS
ncbi:MAG: peptidoglycan-binding domain-containing protein [Gallionella sp.]